MRDCVYINMCKYDNYCIIIIHTRAGVTVNISFLSQGTGGTWSSHGGSEGNLKFHDSLVEIVNKEEGVGEGEEDRESGSEETVIEKAVSQITTDTLKTENSGSWKSAETGPTCVTKIKVSSPDLSPTHSSGTVGSRTISPVMSSRSQSASNIPTTSLKLTSVLSPSSPTILEETPRSDPLSVKRLPQRDSDPFLVMKFWNTDEDDDNGSKDAHHSSLPGRGTNGGGAVEGFSQDR